MATQRKPRKPTAAQQEQARTAAERAAKIFATAGAPSHSLFDAPRVTGAQLKRAIGGMLVRTWNCVPHVKPITSAEGNPSAKSSSLRLMFVGDQAKARHDWYRSDGAPLVCHAVIILPGVPDDCILPRSMADEWTAYALHELGHLLFTNPTTWRHAIGKLSYKHSLPAATVHSYLNGLEDVRQERALMSAGYAAGFGGVVKGLLGRIAADQFAEVVACLKAGNPRAFPFALAYGLRGYVPGGDTLRPALPADLCKIYDYAASALRAMPTVDYWQGTQEIATITDEVLRQLREVYKGAPPTDSADSPDPAEGEDGPGDPAEGEDGPGDPAEGEDGPGDQQDGDQQDGADGQQDGDQQDGADGQQDGDQQGGEGSDNSPSAPQDTGERPASALDAPADSSEPTPVGLPDHVRADVTGAVLPPIVSTVKTQTWQSEADADKWAARTMSTVNNAGALRSALRRLFTRTDSASYEGGRKHGRLRVSALSRVATGADNVFEKRTLRDGFNSAVSIVIDQSSSMGGCISATAGVAYTLAELLSQAAGVTVEICGFQSSGADNGEADIRRALMASEADEGGEYRGALYRAKPMDDDGRPLTDDDAEGMDDYYAVSSVGQCKLNVFKEYATPVARCKGRLMAAWASGGTPDMEALVSAGRRLLAQPAGRHVLIMVTDGQGNDAALITKASASLERAGVTVLSLGIGYEPEGYRHAVQVDGPAGLSGKGLDALLRIIEREQAARDNAA
jgi:hypothetical protein